MSFHPLLPSLCALAIAGTAILPAQSQASTTKARRLGLACHEFETGTGGRFFTLNGPALATYSIWLEVNPPIDTGFSFPTGTGQLFIGLNPGNAAQVAQGIIPAGGIATGTLPFLAPFAGIIGEFQAICIDPSPLVSNTGFAESNTVLKTVVPPRPRPDNTAYIAIAGPPVVFNVTDVEQWDVDADGDLDSIYMSCTGQIQVWLSVNGALQLNQTINVAGGTAIEGADFDNDGLMDMVASQNGGPAVVFINTGHNPNGSLTNGAWQGYRPVPNALTTQNIFSPEVTDVETADFNLDGFLDFVVSCAGCVNGATNRLFFNTAGTPGTGPQFVERSTQIFNGVLDDSEDVETADLNNDGLCDLVFGNFDGPPQTRGVDYYWINQGPLGFAGPFTFPGTVNDETLDVCLGDYDGDGRIDVYVGNWYSTAGSCGPPWLAPRPDRLYLSQGLPIGAGFVDRTDLLTVSSLPTSDVEMADHDLDGDLDIFVAHGNKCVAGLGPVRGLELLVNQRIMHGRPDEMVPLTRPTLNLTNPILTALQGFDIGDLEMGDYQTFWWDRDIGIGHTGGVTFGLK